MASPFLVGGLAGLPGLPRDIRLLLGLLALDLEPILGIGRCRNQGERDLLHLHLAERVVSVLRCVEVGALGRTRARERAYG